MTTLTKEQVEQKLQQLKQLTEEVNAVAKELAEAGVIELSEEDLDKVAGGRPVYEIVGEKGSCTRPDTRRVIKTLLPDPKVGEEPKAILPPGM